MRLYAIEYLLMACSRYQLRAAHSLRDVAYGLSICPGVGLTVKMLDELGDLFVLLMRMRACHVRGVLVAWHGTARQGACRVVHGVAWHSVAWRGTASYDMA